MHAKAGMMCTRYRCATINGCPVKSPIMMKWMLDQYTTTTTKFIISAISNKMWAVANNLGFFLLFGSSEHHKLIKIIKAVS
jgi:hypothetical protein